MLDAYGYAVAFQKEIRDGAVAVYGVGSNLVWVKKESGRVSIGEAMAWDYVSQLPHLIYSQFLGHNLRGIHRRGPSGRRLTAERV
jgi:hypothetical protein